MTSETSQHEANHGEVDHGFGGARVPFVIAIEPAIAPQPAEGTCDHPAARQYFELVQFAALDDLAVDDRPTGVAVAPLKLPQEFPQMRVNLHPEAAVLPLREVMINRAPRRKVCERIAPLTAGAGQIEHGIDQTWH